MCLGKSLPLFIGDLFIIIAVRLGAYNNLHGITHGRMLFDILHPFLEIVKALGTGQTKGDNDRLSILVVHRGEGSESLLSCGIPELQLDVTLALGWTLAGDS